MLLSTTVSVTLSGRCAAPQRACAPAAPRGSPAGACTQRASQRASLSKPARRQLAAPARAGDDLELVTDAGAADPEDARGAIAVGLRLSGAGQWERAQEYFERALELPGTGQKRWRDKPPALSPGELQSALYNIACCRGNAGDLENGLVALAGAVEQGYRDFAQMRSDPDLAALRADERFEGLISRFERKPQGSGFMGLF